VDGIAVGLRQGRTVRREHVGCLLGKRRREVGGCLEVHGAAPGRLHDAPGRPHAPQAAQPLMAVQAFL